MSPQPKNTPAAEADKAPDPDKAPETGANEAEETVSPTLVDESMGGRQIARAMELERRRAALQTEIGKNRDFLRLLDSNDELTEEQGEWLDAFYPLKEKGAQRDKDEIERTKKVKEAARKAA